jgi:hypothetical protein
VMSLVPASGESGAAFWTRERDGSTSLLNECAGSARVAAPRSRLRLISHISIFIF